MVVEMSVEDAAKLAQAIVQDMDMEILLAGPDGQGANIEAAYQSFWFGFIDDFVIRLSPQDNGTRIDVRSKSRVGVSDLGANASRARGFFSKVRERVPNARVVAGIKGVKSALYLQSMPLHRAALDLLGPMPG